MLCSMGLGLLIQRSQMKFHLLVIKTYLSKLANSNAGAIIIAPDLVNHVPQGMIALVTTMPYRAYGLVAGHFYPRALGTGNIHPRAVVHETAVIGRKCIC